MTVRAKRRCTVESSTTSTLSGSTWLTGCGWYAGGTDTLTVSSVLPRETGRPVTDVVAIRRGLEGRPACSCPYFVSRKTALSEWTPDTTVDS
jgi:hypothetical protein